MIYTCRFQNNSESRGAPLYCPQFPSHLHLIAPLTSAGLLVFAAPARTISNFLSRDFDSKHKWFNESSLVHARTTTNSFLDVSIVMITTFRHSCPVLVFYVTVTYCQLAHQVARADALQIFQKTMLVVIDSAQKFRRFCWDKSHVIENTLF